MVWDEEDDDIRRPWFLFFLIFFLGSVIIFALSLWDILFNGNLASVVFISYLILFGAAFVLFLMRMRYNGREDDMVSVFTKTLQGGLFHFQCPVCHGIFAVKESMYHGKEKTMITCPDCGHLGLIHPQPAKVIGMIPEKKSQNVLFQCLYCGESLRIWAEGTELHPHLEVFNCPFCGEMTSLQRYDHR